MTDLTNATLMLQQWEGCKLEAYPDPVSGDAPWTIGYGSTGYNIIKGSTWTQQQANLDLENKISTLYDEISNLVDYDLDDCQYCALISFAYNLGIGALSGSTLLKNLNIDGYGNSHDFLPWCNAERHPVEDLQERRIGEMLLFSGRGVKSQAACKELLPTYYP
jgi:lysozyme